MQLVDIFSGNTKFSQIETVQIQFYSLKAFRKFRLTGNQGECNLLKISRIIIKLQIGFCPKWRQKILLWDNICDKSLILLNKIDKCHSV